MKDTQVGIKLVDRQVIADVLPLLRESRFALDLELLVLARRLGYARIVEAPVRIQERFGSSISLKAVWLLLIDTLGLFVRFSIRHEYDPAIRARIEPYARGGRRVLTRAALSGTARAVVHSTVTSGLRPGSTDGGPGATRPDRNPQRRPRRAPRRR